MLSTPIMGHGQDINESNNNPIPPDTENLASQAQENHDTFINYKDYKENLLGTKKHQKISWRDIIDISDVNDTQLKQDMIGELDLIESTQTGQEVFRDIKSNLDNPDFYDLHHGLGRIKVTDYTILPSIARLDNSPSININVKHAQNVDYVRVNGGKSPPFLGETMFHEIAHLSDKTYWALYADKTYFYDPLEELKFGVIPQPPDIYNTAEYQNILNAHKGRRELSDALVSNAGPNGEPLTQHARDSIFYLFEENLADVAGKEATLSAQFNRKIDTYGPSDLLQEFEGRAINLGNQLIIEINNKSNAINISPRVDEYENSAHPRKAVYDGYTTLYNIVNGDSPSSKNTIKGP